MNKVIIKGYVEHITPYFIIIRTMRQSMTVDYVKVKTISKFEYDIEDYVAIEGSLQTRNYKSYDGKSHKDMYVLANSIVKEDVVDIFQSENSVELTGTLCKKDVLRNTPRGRLIMDFVVAVNNSDGSSSYISCILWAKAAKWLDEQPIGTKVSIQGRFQSREYLKDNRTKIAYEINVNDIHKERN